MSGLERSFSYDRHDEQLNTEQQHQPYNSRSISPPQDHAFHHPPPPPVHRHRPENTPGSSYGQYQNERHYGISNPRRESLVTPGMDNVGDRAAGGGITGVAMGVANANERESGVQALRAIDDWGRTGNNGVAGRGANTPPERRFNEYEQPYNARHVPASPGRRPLHQQPSQTSYSSGAPLAAAGAGAGAYGLGSNSPANYSQRSLSSNPNHSAERFNTYPYSDNPYNRHSASHVQLAQGAVIDPNMIEDDGDDGFASEAQPMRRRSVLPFGHRNSTHTPLAAAGGAAAVGAAGGAGLAASNRGDAAGFYAPVGAGGPPGSGSSGLINEKSEWLDKQSHGNKRLKWIVVIVIAVLAIGGIVGGILGGVVFKKKTDDGGRPPGQSAEDDTAQNGDLDKNSADIKKLLNNPNLKKVFPGMDYTPLNAQYPECIRNPASQNNVTRDIAVLSQLSDNIRLYGTDCNQTSMVLHAIERLDLPDTKIWLGVHHDDNSTTNKRQLDQMWDVFDSYGSDRINGIIVGNEILFREEMTLTELSNELADIRSNLTDRGIKLPLATADLGDKWTAELAAVVDIVMANIHPFFAGVTAEQGPGWTWEFWTTNNVPLTANNPEKRQIIAEVGWPSGGGNSCGEAQCTSDTQGSVAGVEELNTFMEKYVCESKKNGTDYFWFEAFDEPWKIRFNSGDRNWEDKWGLLDVNRNLKKGLTIPDCA